MNRDNIIEALATLIDAGRVIDNDVSVPFLERTGKCRTLTVRLHNLIERTCGRTSPHYRSIATLPVDSIPHLQVYLATAQAVLEDIDQGMFFDIRSLLRAEVLDDFLEQCDALLQAGYHVAAASIAGAVLEDTLRKIATNLGLTVPEKTNIDRLNADIAKAGGYDKLVQKQITAHADLRNNADHGHFDKVRKEDVSAMVNWIRGFVSQHLQ